MPDMRLRWAPRPTRICGPKNRTLAGLSPSKARNPNFACVPTAIDYYFQVQGGGAGDRQQGWDYRRRNRDAWRRKHKVRDIHRLLFHRLSDVVSGPGVIDSREWCPPTTEIASRAFVRVRVPTGGRAPSRNQELMFGSATAPRRCNLRSALPFLPPHSLMMPPSHPIPALVFTPTVSGSTGGWPSSPTTSGLTAAEWAFTSEFYCGTPTSGKVCKQRRCLNVGPQQHEMRCSPLGQSLQNARDFFSA